MIDIRVQQLVTVFKHSTHPNKSPPSCLVQGNLAPSGGWKKHETCCFIESSRINYATSVKSIAIVAQLKSEDRKCFRKSFSCWCQIVYNFRVNLAMFSLFPNSSQFVSECWHNKVRRSFPHRVFCETFDLSAYAYQNKEISRELKQRSLLFALTVKRASLINTPG